MSRLYKPIFFIALVLVGIRFAAAADVYKDTVIYTSGQDASRLIGKKVYILEDASDSFSIQQVIADTHFFLSSSSVPTLGVSNAAFWFRVTIRNESDDPSLLLEIENPLLDEVSIFRPIAENRFNVEMISKKRPFEDRLIKSQNYQFIIRIEPHHTKTFYFKVKSGTQFQVPVNLGSFEEIANDGLNKDLLTSLYLGIMLVMFLYNLFIFISVKDRSYLYYILYILCVTLVQLNIKGLGFKYLWSSFPAFEQLSVYLFPSFTAFASIAFIRKFLNTKEFVPRIHKGFIIFVILYIFTVGNAIYGDKLLSYNLLNINALPLALYMLFVAIYILVKYKYRPAFFFLIAWSVFLISIVLFVLKDVGVLPFNTFTVSFIQIGSAIEAILLSFALADRINILKKEKEASQAEALEIAQENERIIREQNVFLEAKVKDRTKELQVSNNDLSKALKDLKEAETQLVESEKMASLGQLTAGIAHEINNPINFVTSNVRPLRRDVDILIDAMHKVEHLGLSDLSAAEKKEQIEAFKAEIDFDYLKTEIDYLLNGISEGSSRTSEIVKGLRIFSRLDEDDLKRADINEGLDSTIIIVNNLLNNKIEIIRQYGEIPAVDCYPGKLNQVFLNIITNGIHAIKSKFGDAEGGLVKISTKVSDQSLLISISDNGSGMDEKTKHKLFEPFFTTKPVGEGTGLGLSIAYNTIKKHNGAIHVNSVLGEGTEFIIEIPIVQHLL